MAFCYEKKQGCCCVPISNLVCAFLFHLTVHGAAIAIYVFTTYVTPPLYTVDYFFGYMGIALSVTSFITMLFIRLKTLQFVRGFLGFLMVLTISGNFGGTIWFTLERWNTRMTTAIMKYLTGRLHATDPLWYIWIILCWFVLVLSPYYILCIMSCMCNKYNTHLFSTKYSHPWDESLPDTSLQIKKYTDRYGGTSYKPYPVQRL